MKDITQEDIEKTFKSYDGFTSYHSHDINEEEWRPENIDGAKLTFLLEKAFDRQQDVTEEDIIDSLWNKLYFYDYFDITK